MIRHLFRLMWKARKKNTLLALQLFIGFLVIFLLATLAIHNLRKYIQPLGFQYENRWLIEPRDVISLEEGKNIYKQLASFQAIKVSVASIAPYFPSGGSSTRKSEITGKNVTCEDLWLDLAYKDVLELEMAEGRWFNESNLASGNPIVLSPAFKEAYFGKNAGNLSMGDYKIIGVLKNFRRLGEFGDEVSSIIHLVKSAEFGSFTIKVPKNSGIQFEEQLVSKIKSVAPKVSVIVTPLEVQRAEYLKEKLTPLMAIAGIGIFLFVNVILGLFGVLWYSISQRTTEIGIRRAVGATAKNVASQFVSEMLILASIGIIPGIVVALQVQVFNLLETSSDIYILGIVLTALLIYALVSLCAVIPGLKSARIQPVQALSEE